MVYEIHTYGGGDFLVAVLNGVNLLLGGSAYLTLIKAFALLGLIFFIGWIAFSFRFQISWLLWFTLAYLGFFVPKVDVAVIDHLRPANTQVVTGVPALLGYAGYLSSALGDGLTRLMEQAFSLPPELQFRSSGYATSLHAVRASLLDQIPEPYVAGSASRYIRDCVLYDVLDGTKAVNAILTTPDLLTAFASDHPSRFTETHIAPDGSEIEGIPDVVNCAEGYQRLTAGLNAIYNSWWGRFVQALAGSRGLEPVQVDPILMLSYQSLMNVATTPQQVLFQSAMIHSFDEAIQLQAKLTGSDTYLLALTLAQAQYQQRTGLFTMGQLAQRLLPVLRSAVEGLLYGLFPLLMLLLFTPLGAMVLKTYGIGFLWLQFWGPLFAILNLLSSMQTERMLTAYASEGITLKTYRTLEALSADGLAIAGVLSLAVPLIAWALASGTFAGLAHAAGMVTGSAQSAAASAAATASMGNLSTGNVSLSTMSANKFNPAVETSVGATSRHYGAMLEGGFAPAHYGYVTPATGATQLSLSSLGGGISVQVGKRASRELQEAYNSTLQHAQEVFTAEGAQFRETLTRQSERQASTQAEHAYGQSFDQEKSSQQMRMSAAVERVSKQISNKFGISAENAREIAERSLFAKSATGGLGLSASVGRSLGLGKLGIGLEGRAGLRGEKGNIEFAKVQAQRQQAFDEAYNAFTDQEAREAWSLHEQSRSQDQARHVHTTATGERKSTTAGTAKESQSQRGLRELASQLESLSAQMSQAEASSVTLNQDQTAALVQYISGQSGRPESQVAVQIGDAIKFNLMDRSAIGGKTVSQWAQEWYDRNRPAGEGISEKTASLKEGIPARIQRGEDTTASEQAEIGSSVQDQQQAIHAGLGRERDYTIAQGQGVRRDVEAKHLGVEATIGSEKAETSEKRVAIDRSGQDLETRVADFQKEEVSLGKPAVEGIKDLNPWRDPSGSRLSEGREKLLEGTPPHPNFYWEQRLRGLEELKK
jgi:conjugal transfer mating pair stabilization protein TraG